MRLSPGGAGVAHGSYRSVTGVHRVVTKVSQSVTGSQKHHRVGVGDGTSAVTGRPEVDLAQMQHGRSHLA
jgi:hypothetical protein